MDESSAVSVQTPDGGLQTEADSSAAGKLGAESQSAEQIQDGSLENPEISAMEEDSSTANKDQQEQQVQVQGEEEAAFVVGALYVIQRYHQSLDTNSVRLLHHLPQINRCIVELPGGVELAVPPHVLIPKSSASAAQLGAAQPPAAAPIRPVVYLKLEQLPEAVSKILYLSEYVAKPPPKRLELEPLATPHTAVGLLTPPGYVQMQAPARSAAAAVADGSRGSLPGNNLSEYQRRIVGAVVDRLRSPSSSFFLSEGVCVGKTRILAGVIAAMDGADSHRHLWLTASDNIRGIQLELGLATSTGKAATTGAAGAAGAAAPAAAGGSKTATQAGGLGLYPLGLEREIAAIPYGAGVVQCSYGQFASTSRRNGMRRLDAIINWLRPGKGVVVLDDFSHSAIKPNVVTHLAELVDTLQSPGASLGGTVKVVYASHLLYFQNSDLALARVLLQNNLNSQHVLVKADTALALNHAGVLSCAFSDLKGVRVLVRDVPVVSIIASLVDQSYVLWADLWRVLCELQASGRNAGRNAGTGAGAGAGGEDSDDERGGDMAGGPKRAFWSAHAEYFRSLSAIAKISAIKEVVTAATGAGKKTVVSFFHIASEGRVDSPKEILNRTVRTIFPELNNIHFISVSKASAAAPAGLHQAGGSLMPHHSGHAGRPKRKTPESGRVPYVASFAKAHTKTDRFGVRVVENLPTPRFSLSSNAADFRPPRREFAASINKRTLYKIAPRLGPLAEVSDDSDAEGTGLSAPVPSAPPSAPAQAPAPRPAAPATASANADAANAEQQLKLGLSFLEKVNGLANLPTFSAMDLLIDALGGSAVVAEMTGRKTHIVNKSYMRRSDNENATQLAAFLSGAKKVAVVNDLACLGFNLTCDVNVIAEFPVLPLRGVQQIARGYTAASRPSADAIILCSKLGGERFMAGGLLDLLEQFRSAGADPVRGAEVTRPFYFDQTRAKLALDYVVAMCYNPSSYRGNITTKPNMGAFMQALGNLLEPLGWIPGVERRVDSGTRFLQRIAGLPTDAQDHVFAFFASLMEQVR